MNYGQPGGLTSIDRLQDPDTGAAVREAVRFVWRAKWKILVGMLFCATVAVLIIISAKPTYTATTAVLFAPDQRNTVDIDDVIQATGDRGAVANQLEIIRSTNLLDRVVERLRLERFPTFNPSLVDRTWFADRLKSWLDWRTYVPRDLLINLGMIALEPVAEPLSEADALAAVRVQARNILLEQMNIEAVPLTQVLRISVTTDRAKLSADTANTIAREYITAQLNTKLAATREATRWLSERVGELEGEVSAAEAAVNAYTTQLAERSGQTTAVLRQQLEVLNRALSEATARVAQANSRFRRASNASDDTDAIGIVAEFQDSRTVLAARERELALLADRAELLRLVSADHERVQVLDVRLAAARAAVRSEAARIVAALESELRSAQGEQEDLTARVRDIEQQIIEQGGDEVRLRQLEREAEASRLIYENFLGRLKETTQQQLLEEADAVILSPAEVPEEADTQYAKRIIAIALLFGGGLGFGLAVFVERLNNTFRSVDDLQTQTGLTVLGVLPRVAGASSRRDVMRTVVDKPTSGLAEAMRGLRTSVLFSNLDQPPEVVMMTSSVAGEGKSTSALLLATTSVQMGRSAIIVDCDLRRPSLHAFFGERAKSSRGVRGVLEGSATLEEATLVDSGTGLTVLPNQADRNSAAINAADVLASARFGELVKNLRAQYDMVILDAPPVLAVTDAQIISKRTDAVLYCVKWDETPRDVVLDGLRTFSLVSTDLAGLVMTMVNTDKSSSYGYKYGGYYGRYQNPYIEN